MNQFPKTFATTACALAVSLVITACGGGTAPDTTPPTVAITSATSGSTATFTFTFSEDVGTSFDASDVVVTGGTSAASVTKVDATHYTLVVTPAGSGDVTVSLAAAKFKDLAMNDNTATATASYTPSAPVVATGVTFDETTAPSFVGFDGAEGSAIETGPAGGSGKALKILRSGGQVWAGAKVTGLSIPLSSTNTTITARVYSPTAGIPFVLKMEGGGASAEYQATTAVVVGWQTLTWVLAGADLKSWTDAVFLPNLGTLGAGEAYYVDDITGVTYTPPAPVVAVDAGAGGAQTMAISTGDPKGIFAVGDAIFAADYVGGREAAPPNNLASYVGAKSTIGGNIGYYVGGELLAGTNTLEQAGWVVGTVLDAGGIPNFFRYAVLTGTSANFANSWMGMYANAPNNGTVNVSTKGNIKFRLWGPAEMYQQTNLNPVIEIVLSGPKIAGCTTTGSGATEIKKTFVANQKIGAGSSYSVSLAGWTAGGVCGTDTTGTAVASVLANLATVSFNVPATSFNFTNKNAGTTVSYSTGLNIGPIGFTN